MVKVSYQELEAQGFYAVAFDGCHKIYLLKTEDEKDQCEGLDYEVYKLSSLKDIYEDSCPLRFIQDWDTSETPLVRQGQKAKFVW